MTDYAGAWTETRVEAFLEETTVPVRLATHRPDDSLWLVALWYRYRDGELECATWAGADVVRFLRHDPDVAFDVSTNHPPYRGVRGAGTAKLSRDRDKRVLRDLLKRYLGSTDSELAAWLLDEDRKEVRIRVSPRRVYSWDYSERMATVSDGT